MDADIAHATRAQPSRIEGPLTVEVINTLSTAQETANEIRHRLFQLRDRLTGSPPQPADSNSANGTADAPHFKGAHSDKSAALLSTLAEIDSISTDLANRL